MAQVVDLLASYHLWQIAKTWQIVAVKYQTIVDDVDEKSGGGGGYAFLVKEPPPGPLPPPTTPSP